MTDSLALPAQSDDALAAFRLQVRQELEEKSEKGKLSESALAKLRAIREQDKTQAIADDRFATALKSVIVTDANLRKLIGRSNVSVPATQLARRAAKLGWWIAAGFRLGYEIDSITMVNFFSDITQDERTMSDARFSSLWNVAAAEKLRASRLSRGAIPELPTPRVFPQPVEDVDFTVTRDLSGNVLSIVYLTSGEESMWTGLTIVEPVEPKIRFCKSGKKCLGYTKRKAAPVKGKGDYCSRNCSDCDGARSKRALLAIAATPKVSEVGFSPLGAA